MHQTFTYVNEEKIWTKIDAQGIQKPENEIYYCIVYLLNYIDLK